MMGNFDSTSARYILIMPLLTCACTARRALGIVRSDSRERPTSILHMGVVSSSRFKPYAAQMSHLGPSGHAADVI